MPEHVIAYFFDDDGRSMLEFTRIEKFKYACCDKQTDIEDKQHETRFIFVFEKRIQRFGVLFFSRKFVHFIRFDYECPILEKAFPFLRGDPSNCVKVASDRQNRDRLA